MAFVSDELQVQLQRHVQHQVWPTVSVPREGSQTLVKSLLELQHQTLRRRRCHSPSLSVPHDHDEHFCGSGHLLHYRVHPNALAPQCETQPSRPLHSTEIKMRLSNQ